MENAYCDATPTYFSEVVGFLEEIGAHVAFVENKKEYYRLWFYLDDETVGQHEIQIDHVVDGRESQLIMRLVPAESRVT